MPLDFLSNGRRDPVGSDGLIEAGDGDLRYFMNQLKELLAPQHDKHRFFSGDHIGRARFSIQQGKFAEDGAIAE